MTASRDQHGASGLHGEYGGYGSRVRLFALVRTQPAPPATYELVVSRHHRLTFPWNPAGTLEAQADSHPRQKDEFAGFVDSPRLSSRCCRSSRRWSVPISSASDQYCGRDCRKCCGREPTDRIEHRWIMLWITLGIMPLTQPSGPSKTGAAPSPKCPSQRLLVRWPASCIPLRFT